ncbi:UPF0280 family protein [Desulfosporosinus sp. BICA1-9]|uniref:UPF0280 family protein n=1 Tax=Desulfosporosinus sp. BICA1-9 TaxID=1531958 RepID=UPI00054BF0D1|nr:UPF0280 family protein [Desulfosporosinus sp. BICA1-9]KJS47435.1 MAG: thiamine biosynthesis protein ApbE [Peptococcaceae bacterium BRH_c23]KJS90328.1 MAG: thiamine biosynthesis protein ApbE [Desulfosporosinus sp. BICA1-9]HBW38566.1 UPF0280 family protein [Desulfosporosinus sp.]
MDFVERSYRQRHRQEDLVHFQVTVGETDLDIGVRKERLTKDLLEWVEETIRACRRPLEDYIQRDPGFVEALAPYTILPNAPLIVQTMAEVGRLAGVGPMAAVAGAVAELVGKSIAKRSRDVIVENGGDIFLRTSRIRKVGIFAGDSPLSNRVAIEIRPEQTPLGICTSSGKVGHSLSFGKADAVVVISPSVPLADAVATATGNLIKTSDDLERALEFAAEIKGVTGVVVIKDDRLAVWGSVKLIPMNA